MIKKVKDNLNNETDSMKKFTDTTVSMKKLGSILSQEEEAAFMASASTIEKE